MKAFDFATQLEEMRADGELSDDVTSANIPREIKRTAVITSEKIGACGFG
jgi:hypothetical protein